VLFWLSSPGRESTVRQALASQTRWARVRFVVATANSSLGLDPAAGIWLLLSQSWPRRRLIDLQELDYSDAL
jgi:hypothetical protein